MRAKKAVLIITEKGRAVGVGHYTRSLNLAAILQEHYNVQLSYLQKEDDGVDSLSDNVSETRYTDEESLRKSVIQWVANSQLACVIIDWAEYSHLRCDFIALLDARKVIFGLPPNKRLGDVVVNVAEGGDWRSCVTQLEGGTLLAGPKYVFLKPSVLALRGTYVHQPLRTVLLVFGGTDPSGLLLRSLRQLAPTGLQVQALANAQHRDYPSMRQIVQEHDNVRLQTGYSDIAQFFLSGEVLVSAPGNLMFEGLCYGIPTVCFCQNEKQTSDFQKYPNVYSASYIRNILQLVKTSHAEYVAWESFCQQTEVGQGVPELVRAIKKLAI